MKKGLCWLIICLSIGVCQSAYAKVYQYRLGNGLTVLVKPDHRAPVVVSMVWYKVGGAYELPGKSGISHMLEHMMFKGTKRYGPNVLPQLISNNGGVQNAFTTTDYTAYFQELAADKLALSFKLEADRMRHLLLDKTAYNNELQVVKEERFMRTDDNPQALTQERLRAAAFLTSPYHHPLVGWLNDLNNLTISDVRQWYHAWYTPNNAIVVVVGDVKPVAVKQLAKQYFGPLSPSHIPSLKPQLTPPLLGTRQVDVHRPAQLPWVILAYNVPNLKTAPKPWQAYALYVAMGVLAGDSSARLPQQLVRGKQLAASADANYTPFTLFPSLFTLDAVPSRGHTVKQVQHALQQQVLALQQGRISVSELQRVKMQVLANQTYAQDSIMGQAMQLGSFAAVGLPWQLATQFSQHIQAVTAAQVQAVANTYLVPTRLTIAHLRPMPLSNNTKHRVFKSTPLGDEHVS